MSAASAVHQQSAISSSLRVRVWGVVHTSSMTLPSKLSAKVTPSLGRFITTDRLENHDLVSFARAKAFLDEPLAFKTTVCSLLSSFIRVVL